MLQLIMPYLHSWKGFCHFYLDDDTGGGDEDKDDHNGLMTIEILQPQHSLDAVAADGDDVADVAHDIDKNNATISTLLLRYMSE